MEVDKVVKYMDIARAVSQLSKDPSTKVGAIVLGAAHEVRSLGYNGAPRGSTADEDERTTTRPEKYFWLSHAELNAITNAARVGIPLDKCVLVVTHPPCMDCARAIVQAGITEVFYPQPDSDYLSRWSEHHERSIRLFKETGVKVYELQKCPDGGTAAEAGGLDGGECSGRTDPAHGGGSERPQVTCSEGVRQSGQIFGTGYTPVERGKTIDVAVPSAIVGRCDGQTVFKYRDQWFYRYPEPAGGPTG